MSLREKKLNIVLGEQIEDVCRKETIKAVGRSIYPLFRLTSAGFPPGSGNGVDAFSQDQPW